MDMPDTMEGSQTDGDIGGVNSLVSETLVQFPCI